MELEKMAAKLPIPLRDEGVEGEGKPALSEARAESNGDPPRDVLCRKPLAPIAAQRVRGWRFRELGSNG